MVKKILVGIMVLMTTFIFALYPYLSHPPFVVFKNGLATFSVEYSTPKVFELKVIVDDDSFVIKDSTSTLHMIKIPLKRDFVYVFNYNGETLKNRIYFPSENLKEFTMAVVGDTRANPEVFFKIVTAVRDSNFMLHLGDIAYTEFDDTQWRNFFKALSMYGRLVFTVKGNHEMPGLRYDLYLSEKNYTFRIGSYRFFILDSSVLFNFAKLRLKEYLKSYKDEKTKKIVVFHHPVINCEVAKLTHIIPSASEAVYDVLKKYDIKLVISSHSHNYQRIVKDGITFLIIGGGGAPIYRVNSDCSGLLKWFEGYSYGVFYFKPKVITVRIYDLNRRVIDEFSINYRW